MTHPLQAALNLMTHPLAAPAHTNILFDQSLIVLLLAVIVLIECMTALSPYSQHSQWYAKLKFRLSLLTFKRSQLLHLENRVGRITNYS